MQRRSFLAGAGAATAITHHRAVAQAAKSRVLRYVPQADLTVIDPVMTTAYITRYHATMVWDQLYGIDSKLQPQPQMVEGHTIEDDGRLWTFTLRDGLRFHDGEPVRGRDCVASIKRWAARDPMGQALLARVAEMARRDDRRFTIRLTRPFNLVLNCLSKIGPPALMVMPERLAKTDPVPVDQGDCRQRSVPFRCRSSAWSAARWSMRATRITCRARTARRTGWPGPKIVNFDRVEWTVMPDPGHRRRGAGERRGRLVGKPAQRPAADAATAAPTCAPRMTGPLGTIGTGVFNHLHPPFDKPAVRRVDAGGDLAG